MSEVKNQEKKAVQQTSHHDRLFKQAYSNPRMAKELFQLVFSEEEFLAFDWDRLRAEKDIFQDKRADLVFSVPLKSDPSSRFRIGLLLEHKSQYSRGLFYQMPAYQFFIIGKTFKEGEDVGPVIPVLFYHGKEPWKGNSNPAALCTTGKKP